VEWIALLQSWTSQYGCRLLPPVAPALLSEIERTLGPFPMDLRDFYAASNGLNADSLRILPIEFQDDMKRTWDGLKRANDPNKTRFLGQDPGLLKRFLVFAVLPGQCAVALDRDDGSIWYEEGDELNQTDLGLAEFIGTSLAA